MMRERLLRIFIIGAAALLIISVAKTVADWRGQTGKSREPRELPSVSLKDKLEDLGGEILGKTVKVLPGAQNISQISQEVEVEQAGEETEPIEEPVKDVQRQTEILIELIKKLPEDQMEAIKEQIYKEVCEGVLSKE